MRKLYPIYRKLNTAVQKFSREHWEPNRLLKITL